VDVRRVVRLEKAWPSRPRIEFRVRAEQRQPAESAGVDAIEFVVEECAAEGSLGAVLQEHALFLGAESCFELMALCIGRRSQVESGHVVSCDRCRIELAAFLVVRARDRRDVPNMAPLASETKSSRNGREFQRASGADTSRGPGSELIWLTGPECDHV
jgi:hypothetical protein